MGIYIGLLKDASAFIVFIILAHLVRIRSISYNQIYYYFIFAAILDGIFTIKPELHNLVVY